MNTNQIIETAIQGHASTRDAIRWAIQQEREACAKPKGDLVCVCGAVWEGDLMVHAPIQRKPLTEPELHEINPTWPAPGQQWDYEDVLAFVRAVEVKLKEKNHG